MLEIFKNSEEQAKKGEIGGKIAGKLNTVAQQKQRSELGKTFGKKVGLSRQSNKLREILDNQRIVWLHKSGVEAITSPPLESFKSICQILETKVPNQIRNETSFIKVLYNERKTLYSWSIKRREVIRSEVKDER